MGSSMEALRLFTMDAVGLSHDEFDQIKAGHNDDLGRPGLEFVSV